ncbi:Serine/threonine-protein kinase [Microbotryomycetes sp. JL201]|nr:Serine/threonine-protein kinase [Microbotryomycetes sp. JL201]
MGNSLSTAGGMPSTAAGVGPGTTASTSSSAAANGLGGFLSELGGDVVYDKSMGTSRFLKTIRARHRQGPLVVKIFAKADPSWSLKPFLRRIKAEREALNDCPNVLTYQRALETERTGYLVRQWTASNLYDRISTRPFLSQLEKRWIAFQLLTGLHDMHERGCSHGDIKTENVAVTSWNWVYLTDLASFKPTYLPLDDPSTFSYYFDTSSRRTCYIAPERFCTSDSDTAKRKATLEFGARDGKITQSMDVFSLGCVLAELWMEGTPPFTLSQLFKYREGQYSPETYLAEIDDQDIRIMIRSMLSLDPADRMTCAEYLAAYQGSVFPNIFSAFLHPFISALNDSTSGVTPPVQAPTKTPLPGSSTPTQRVQETILPTLKSDADERIERIWAEWETISEYLDRDSPLPDTLDKRTDDTQSCSGFPLKLNLPGAGGQPVVAGCTEDGPALILLSLVCANVRNCVRPSSIIRALDILLALLRYVGDETKLDRLLPFIVTLLQDDVAFVRASALQALTQTILVVETITPSNAAVFPEYILPNTRPLASDAEVLPRVTYAECIAALASQSKRFLEMAEAMKAEGTFKVANVQDFASSPYDDNYDTRLLELQNQVQDHVAMLLSDQSSAVKRALLYHVSDLCAFFGPIKANDAILAHLVTYLNTRDWLLRAAWNENAADVAACVGIRSLEEYILPLITLSLSDVEEFVVVKVLSTLTKLTEKRLLVKARTWELVAQVTGLLCHPNIWIREGAAEFLASTAKKMTPTDCWCILYPTIKRLLRADVREITALSLLDNAREPLSRNVFEAAVSWAGRAGKSNFWSLPRATVKGAPRDVGVRTDEDHAQLDRMRQLGMRTEDEYKLSMLKDHIAKLALARQANPKSSSDKAESLSMFGDSALRDLGVVPQTIFFSIRPADEVDRLKSGLGGLRRFSSDSPRSPSSLDLSRPSGSRTTSGQPLEDLRRRLALASGDSTSSIQAALRGHAESPGRFPHDRLDLHRTISEVSTDVSDTASTTSTKGEIVQPSPRSHVHRNVVEVGRAGAAVAEDGTNAVGMFNIDKRYKDLDDSASVTTHQESATGSPLRHGPASRGLPARRFVTTYEGNDPNIKNLLERMYLDNFREPVPELGPFVPQGIPKGRALRTSFMPRERTPTRPEGTLIAHLIEHTGAITDIQVSPDQLFVATGSEDGTVKIWDTMRLEKNVTSRSRQTFEQGGKITCVCILENSHCVASASDNGTLWIHRIDIGLSGAMPKYGKNHLVRQVKFDRASEYVTCMSRYNTGEFLSSSTETATNLVLATSLAQIIVLDVRTMRRLHTYDNPLHLGPISALCVDAKRIWCVVGTASGSLSLWDLRFGLLLRSWSVGEHQIRSIHVHPCRGKNRWVIVALESGPTLRDDSSDNSLVAEVWDIDRGVKVEEVRSTLSSGSASAITKLQSRPTIPTDSIANPATAIEDMLNRSQLPASVPRRPILSADYKTTGPGVCAILIGSHYSNKDSQPPPTAIQAKTLGEQKSAVDTESGFMVTGGEDCKLRYWDLARASKSAIVSGLELGEEVPIYSYHQNAQPALVLESTSSARSRQGNVGNAQQINATRVHRSTHIASAQQQMLRAHKEAITALALIDLPFRCVVSGDRSGVIKVFE